MRQLATMGSFGYQHSVGISMPAVRAASRMVAPGVKSTRVPLMVNAGIPAPAQWGGNSRLLRSASRCKGLTLQQLRHADPSKTGRKSGPFGLTDLGGGGLHQHRAPGFRRSAGGGHLLLHPGTIE